ncbi:phage/plasmid primase, P4 family [Streptomyces sp. DSM 44915]|uniref:Phage/plasmid primase, P4 family n=1 Tax=Streptomyces chisholmiae TaxID=3075540 RepID=A0ABU2JSM2_9ACTN|nr:phage/plasmid primase, P4 family [Streptomyces sp. DSM 44915]MDT0267965.1 phage/plasmid primase, P4 family [Streptomyces sp. DSM 44915]
MQFADILGRFPDQVEQSDGGYLATCPAHPDTRPSLRIWLGENGTVRIHCRAGCDPAAVVSAAGLKWADMFNAEDTGSPTVPAGRPGLVGPGPVAALRVYVDDASVRLQDFGSDTAQDARDYLRQRFGLDPEAAAELVLGLDEGDEGAENSFPYRSRAWVSFPRLVVPFADFSGVIRAAQARDLTGKSSARWVSLSNPEGGRWGSYGVFRGNGGRGVIVVTEGPSDALTAVAAGYTAVAVRGAALASNGELAEELAAGLKGARVVVAGDHDAAGETFTLRLAAALAASRIDVYTLTIPQAGDDLTDWRERDPERFPELLRAAVDSAQAVTVDGMSYVDTRTGALIPGDREAHEAVSLVADLADRYGPSDVLNAHALVAFTKGTIKYAPGLGFFSWNGSTWIQSDAVVRQWVHHMGAALTAAASDRRERAKRDNGGTLPKDFDDRLGKASLGFTMTRKIDALLRELRTIPSVLVDAEEFDKRPDLLSFSNGVVDLRTGQLRPHDPADMLTVMIPIRYDPQARADRWERFLSEIMPTMPSMPAYLRRLIGYGITGNTSEQCFCILWGSGANGKSVFTDTLTEVFKEITRTTPFATFESKRSGGIPNDLAALRDARLVMASEGEAGRTMSEATLKQATGTDKMTARFLRREFFTFTPSFLILLATNHRPAFKGQDTGLWRRVKMIPFTRYFAENERDYELADKLLEESAGIAAWAVRGAMEWYAGGLKDPTPVKNATREYRETSDALSGFLPGVIEKTGDDADQLLGNEAFRLYLEWCEAENLPQKEQWRRTTFYRALEERGVTRRKTKRGITLFGVRESGTTAAAAGGPGIFGQR